MSGPNWLGLLKWSLSYSDGTSSSNFQEMSLEEKEWLSSAMKELVKDEGTLICTINKKLIQLIEENKDLSSSSQQSEEEKQQQQQGEQQLSEEKQQQQQHQHGGGQEEQELNDEQKPRLEQFESEITLLFEELHPMIDQIDMANIFIKFGGLTILSNLLSNKYLNEELKSYLCIIIGEVAQNNHKVQEQIIKENDFLENLCLLSLTSRTNKLALKSLYSISCIVRGYETAELKFFYSFHGSIFLYKLFQRNNKQITSKILFFLSALLSSSFINYERVATYCQVFLDPCLSFLSSSFSQQQQQQDEEESELALNVIYSLTMTTYGKQYLKEHQERIVEVLNHKYLQIVEEQRIKREQNSNFEEEDQLKYTLNTITEIIETIKNTEINHHSVGGNESTTSNQQSSGETILRLCG